MPIPCKIPPLKGKLQHIDASKSTIHYSTKEEKRKRNKGSQGVYPGHTKKLYLSRGTNPIVRTNKCPLTRKSSPLFDYFSSFSLSLSLCNPNRGLHMHKTQSPKFYLKTRSKIRDFNALIKSKRS